MSISLSGSWTPVIRAVSTVLLAQMLSVPGVASSSGSVRQQSNLADVDVVNLADVDVVIVAHADDWQVFMGDAIVERIRSGHRPVLIYLTAGDHGREGTYWRQREAAAMQSTRVALGSTNIPAQCDSAFVNAHQIAHCRLGWSESYFLRLPDGNRNGAGFARNRFESMRKLRSGRLHSIIAVDSSTRYASWQDLSATVSMLARMVADSAHSRVIIHTTDPSIRVNPHDHYDHRMAGKLTESLLNANGWVGRYYVGYALAMRAPNRTTLQQQEKTGVFSAYDREMMLINPAWSAYREHPRFYADCMERTYSRSAIARVVGSRR
ncbi:MAG TPA: PIG-L family deacetylase [Gemmatimonadaceae bacterium]|jgi:LmbE family N-acetylglucosaminyl deacetylase|nr:PIG-L family deacetylase [Gemmatimonadaceae bacterium]